MVREERLYPRRTCPNGYVDNHGESHTVSKSLIILYLQYVVMVLAAPQF